MAFDSLLDPILNPLLSLGPLLVILIISVIIALFTTFIYKYTTDQDKLRKLKADLKRYQKKAQAAQKDNPEKAMAIQKDMMKLNGQYMKASFKSTLYTFIPVLIFFGWLGAHLAFAPLMAGVPFSISAELQPSVNGSFILNLPDGLSIPSPIILAQNTTLITWENITGVDGTYELSILYNKTGEEHFFPLMISPDNYLNPVNTISESTTFKSININHKKLYIFREIPVLKDVPWVKNWGWLWSYILFSIIFSTGLRKILKLA